MGATIGAGLTIPPASSINAVAQPRTIAFAGARSLIPVTYGIDRVPALLLNILAGATAGTLVVQCLWGHACHDVTLLRLNDRALPGAATVTTYTGAQSAPDATLQAAFAAQGIPYTDTLAGYAYSVILMPASTFDGQLGFSAQVHGRRVYDPRLDSTAGGAGSHRLLDPATWAWSDNPALALADWAANASFGAGSTVDWATVGPAAVFCDAMIGAPAERRRIVGVTLSGAASVPQVADALRAYAGCWLVPGASGLRIIPDQDAAPVATYVHAAGSIAAMEPLALRDMGNAPTAVEVVYTDTTQVPWRDAVALATLPGAGTTAPWRLSSIKLPGIHRHSQAKREAIERLNKLTLSDMTTALDVFDAGAQHDPGDIVLITHPSGVTAKPMRVTACEALSAGRWRLQLAEHDPAAYSSVVETAPVITDTGRIIGDPAGVNWSDVSGRPALFNVFARGLSDTSAPGGRTAGFYNGETGAIISGGGRGWHVIAIHPTTLAIVHNTGYDTFISASNSSAMASALAALPAGLVVAIYTDVEPKTNRLDGGLPAQMYRCGASRSTFGSPDFKDRAAYCLVGLVGSGEGNGHESYSGTVDSDTNAWCDASFTIANGRLLVSGTTHTPRTLNDYGYVGALDATRNVTWRQAEPPSDGVSNGDVWYDTDNGNRPYDRIGGVWLERRLGVGGLADDARPRKVFAQVSAPQAADQPLEGDIWIDTNDNNAIYVRTGADWVAQTIPQEVAPAVEFYDAAGVSFSNMA